MANERAVDLALDLARMPAFASTMAAAPLPVDILDVIRIAAVSPEACRAAASSTGQPEPVLVEAARFYLQQILFRPGADCYRILGVRPGGSREVARAHLRWLLLWLHPDRNGGWEAVYAERIVKAWRELSTGAGATRSSRPTVGEAKSRGRANNKTRPFAAAVRLPLIERPFEKASTWGRKKKKWYARFRAAVLVVAGTATILLLLG
jgi:hypothetical protein